MPTKSIPLVPQKLVFNLSNSNNLYSLVNFSKFRVSEGQLIQNNQTANFGKNADLIKNYSDRTGISPIVNDQLEQISLEASYPQENAENSGKYLTPFERLQLEKSLQKDLPNKYRQRIEIMLLADQGSNQAEIIKTLGCCQDTARRWMLMAQCGMALSWQDNRIGRPKKIDRRYLERLKELVTQSPKEFGYCFQRWTANWLKKHLAKELNIEVSERHINHLLKQMGLSTKLKKNATKSVGSKTISIGDL